MVHSEYLNSIIFAAVALEGAHAVLLQMCLERIMGESSADSDERSRLIEQKANKLLLEVGFAEMVEITSTILLEEADRPAAETVEACKLGITIRNEIMHALSKKGQYKLRNRTNDQISKACSDMINLYKHFTVIIERNIANIGKEQQTE